jgi:orotidine-5'-phosphate decarboxylase
VEEMKRRGLAVFLDLKWHDIPNTVAGAVTNARDLGVDMASVHALGGSEMIAAAAAAAANMALVAITVLTSHGPDQLAEVFGRRAEAASEVGRLARIAIGAGADGVVCSSRELPEVREIAGDLAPLVVPGIRPAEATGDDQRRVATPKAAAAAGATHLVVGRPIITAGDPGAAFRAIAEAAS